MSNARTELYKTHSEGHEKYTYFLLAAAGAAIAFAVTQTQTATLTLSKIPLGLAIGCWALSFFAGCRQIQRNQSIVLQNYQFLRMQEGMHPEFPPHPQLVQAISEQLEEQTKESGKWGAWQFRFLITGAVFYITWHVFEMYLRTPPSTF
jgi:hypothetical protein